MNELVANTELAGEMLNPATENISAEVSAPRESALRSIPKTEIPRAANRGLGEAITPVPEMKIPEVRTVRAGAEPLSTDAESVTFDAETGARSVNFSPNIGEVLQRRTDSEYVQAWLRNPGDEAAALRAGFVLYRRLNPEVSEVGFIDAMRCGVLGAGTDTPRNFANRLFEITGGNADALELASQIERGEISPQDALRSLSADTQAELAEVGEWQSRKPSKVADAFRQTVFDSNAEQDWRALRADGFSAKEILSVFKLTEILGRGDKSTAADWFPRMMQDAEIPAHRRGSVLEAVKARLPEEDADFWSRLWTRTGEMAETVSSSLVNASEAKGAAEILKYGAAAFDADRAFTEQELTMLNAVLGTESGFFGDEVRKKLSAQGINYEAGKFHQLTDTEKLALTRAYREAARESADIAQARAVVLTNYAKKFADGNAVADWTADNLPGIAENLAWLGASIATYGAASPLMLARYGADSYGNTFNEALAQGADVARAATAGKISAVGTTALEAIPLGRLLGIAGRGVSRFTQGLLGENTERVVKSLSEITNSDLADLFLPKTFLQKSVKGAKSFAGTFGTEMGTELSQAALEGGATQWAIDGDWRRGAANSLWDSSFGKDGFDLAASIFAISLGGEAMARGAKWRDHRKAVEEAVRRSGATPESRAEAEQIFIAEAKNAYARKATLEVMAAIDNASDGRAFGNDGKLTADMQAFVHRAMIPGTDENGNATDAYDRRWSTKKKNVFLREINGGEAVPAKMREALDLLHATSEVAGEQVKEAFDKLSAAAGKQVAEGARQLADGEAGANAGATLPENAGAAVNPTVLSGEHLGELTRRFLEENREMGDADISKELRTVFLGEKAEGADEKVVAALNGVAKRCTSAFEYLSFLDAYAASCDKGLKTRTNAKTRAARVLYYGFQHVGTLSRPDTHYERFTRLAYFAGTQTRRSLGALTEEQRGKMQTMLGKIFAGTQVQLGGIPAWASAEAQAAIARGEINGLYASGKIWIADDAFVGTGLHEAVWHATWAWAKSNAPELYKQMQEYVRNAPKWLREQIAQDYAGKADTDFDEIADEIGAFMFENEFEGDFLNGLNKEARSWWDGLRKAFGSAFKKLRGNDESAGDAHTAVRELMKGFLSGETVARAGGNTVKLPVSARFPDGQREAASYERYSAAAAAMNRTGDIPDGKSPREVAAGIEANNKVSVTGTLSEDIRKAADAWCETAATSARRALAGKMLAAIPERDREVDLPDGRVVEITSNGIANILQHMPNVKSKFRDGALDFVLKLPEFFANAEEFYREFKGVRHGSFGGVVDFNGTPFYVSVTCTGEDSLRVKAVNSIKKASLNAWTETTASGESESVLKAAFKLGKETAGSVTARLPKEISAHSSVKAPAASTANVLKWILLNQDKTAADFRLFLRGWDDAEEVRRKGDERWSKAHGFSHGDAEAQRIEAEAQRIEAEAKANGTWLKAPNGKPSKLNERQWVQVRTAAFKKWFGDWEKAARIEKLKTGKPVEISGNEIVASEDFKTYRKNAKNYGASIRGLYTNKDTGEIISVSMGGINEVVSHDSSVEQFQSVAAIPRMIEDSIFIETLPNEDKAKHPDVSHYSYYVCGLKIGGIDYTAKIVVALQKNGERYYDHKLTQIEKGALLSTVSAIHKAGEESTTPLSAVKDKRLLSILQVDSSKVVDENGEPMVVYHGSETTYNEFVRYTWGRGQPHEWETSHWFSSDKKIAKQYKHTGGRLVHAFINIKNPLVVNANGKPFDLMSVEFNGKTFRRTDDVADAVRKDGTHDGVLFVDVKDWGGIGAQYAVFDSEQIKSATDNAGTFDSSNPDIRYSLSAFHGSPHRFEAEENAPFGRFRDDKMGSGEGAQAFGWGHYLTDIELQARGFAAGKHRDSEHGNLYTAEFDDAVLLDWTKPLTKEQLGAFQDSLRGMSNEAFKAWTEFRNRQNDANVNAGLGEYLQKPEDIHAFAKKSGNAETVSKALFAAGFVGHKFPVQYPPISRKFSGTNYVIYDESALRITDAERWSKARATFASKFNLVPTDAQIGKLLESPNVVLDGYVGQYPLERDAAREWIKRNIEGKTFTIDDTGEEVRVGKAGRKKVTSHGYTDAHWKSIADIPTMLKNSIFIHEGEAESENSKYNRYRYYVLGVELDGKPYTVKIVVGVSNGKLYYDHSLTQIEKGALVESVSGIKIPTASDKNALSAIKDTKLLGILQARIAPERHSRVYRSADTHEQELSRMAGAVALASKMIAGGKETVRLPEWLKSLPEWERIGVINRAHNLFRVAKARGAVREQMSEEAAMTAAVEANRAVMERFVHAVAADAMANGAGVESMARGRLREETERRARSRSDIPAGVSDEARRLGEVLLRSQGAKAAIEKSAKTLEERAGAFGRVCLEAAQSRGMGEGVPKEKILGAVIADAEKYVPSAEHLEKLRELRRAVSLPGFAGADEAAKVRRASAADLIAETEAAISIQKEMLESGMSAVKDRAVDARVEEENAGAQRAEENAMEGFESEDPSVITRRIATEVLAEAWRKTARSLGLRGADVFVEGEDAKTPAAVLKLIVLTAQKRADDLEAEADEMTAKLHNGGLTAEEARGANGKRNALREQALLVREAVSAAGTFTEVFKRDAEAQARGMLKQGGGFGVANALSALRNALTLREALGRAYKLFMTASTREAAASIPYLSGRLRGLLFSLPKLDERTEDDVSYYTARFRVLANQLREVGKAWWNKSFEEVQAEIERLENLENRDDHANAKLQALQMAGGARQMSAEMLDTAFWTILTERDTAFLEQVSGLRERRAEAEARAKDFVEALKANPHAKPADKSARQTAKENTMSQNGLSLGDRLRGWIKNAKGELWEKASAFVDDFERRFSDAASEHDRLVVEQHDWQRATMRKIFGNGWQAKVAELSTVVVPELAKFDRTSRDGVKTDDGLTAMHALHLYMSARQKSFQAVLLNPTAFAEESPGALLSRKAYVEQAKDGGELETFLKTYQGGVLWKLKEAWAQRWAAVLPKLNEAYRKVYGFDMYDPFGETDYYPLRLKSEAKAYAAGTTAKSGAIMLPVGRRFQSRTLNVAELDANRKFAEVVFEQMENTLHTIAYAEVHRDAERFMGNTAISDVRNARVAYSDVNGFKDHLADVLALPAQQGEASRMGRFAAGTSTVLALAGNLFTPIRQMTGGGTYAAESPFGVGATTAAMTYAVWGTLWGGQYMSDLLRVVRDPLFRARYEEAARFVEQEALRGNAGTGVSGATKRFFKKLKNASLYGVRFGDAVPIMTCGVGFYRMFYAQNLRKGMADGQAHEKAMNAMTALTEKTQQTRRVMNKTRLQRDTGLTGQLLGQFKSMNDQAFGNETRVLADLAADLKSAKRWKKAMKSVAAYHLLFGAFSDFVMQSVFIALSGDDDDEMTFWEKLNLWELGAASFGGGLYGSTIAFVAFDLMNVEDVGRRIANWAFDAEIPRHRPATVAASLPSVSILLNAGTHTAKAVSMLGDEEVEAKDAFVEFCKSFGGAKLIMRLVDKITEDSEEYSEEE